MWCKVYNWAFFFLGFPSIRHNEICDLTANLLADVVHEVQVEFISSLLLVSIFLWLPPMLMMVLVWTFLKMVSGEAVERKLSLMSRFLIPMFQAIILQPPKGIYRRHENSKKYTYEARIRKVEHATFTPLVFLQQEKWLMRPRIDLVPGWPSWLEPCMTHRITKQDIIMEHSPHIHRDSPNLALHQCSPSLKAHNLEWNGLEYK